MSKPKKKDWPSKILLCSENGFNRWKEFAERWHESTPGGKIEIEKPQKFPCIVVCQKVERNLGMQGATVRWEEYLMTYVYPSDFDK